MAQSFAALQRAGVPLIDLSISNPTQAGILLPDPFVYSTLTSGAYEPQARGARELREEVCRYYETEFHSVLHPDRILLTTSTSEAYGYCFKLIADPGTTILLPQPSYPLLQFLVEAEGLKAKTYPLHEAAGQWILDRERLCEACDSSTRAIVLVHPNNPTGHFLSNGDLDWLLDFTRDKYWLICDEVFADYVWSQQPDQIRSLSQIPADNVFCLSGISKICALPQMKLGWIVMPASAAIHHSLELVADTYLSVSSPIQAAASQWLSNRALFQSPIRNRCLENRNSIQASLQHSAWSLLPVEAGWAAILQGPSTLDEEQKALALMEKGFSAHPGFYYDLPFQPSFVISLLTPPAHLKDGLAALIAS